MKARERLLDLPSSLIEELFLSPTPALGWTGEGVRRHSTGRGQFVRHAMEPAERSSAASLSSIEVPKLLVVEHVDAVSVMDFRAWLADSESGETVVAAIASSCAHGREFKPNDRVIFAYEPRLTRTRIVWPWKAFTDVHEPEFMQAIWRRYFEAPDQPELRTKLLRWTSPA